MTPEPPNHKDRWNWIKKQMCPCMVSLIEHCRKVGVYFGGCGDCGSAWLECKEHGLTVDLAHYAFDDYYGGHK